MAPRLSRGLLLAALSVLLVACSLFHRPDPTLAHVVCDLIDQDDGTLEFRAWSRPYDPERFLMSLPDQLLHATAAPGRQLSAPLLVEGADCAGGAWPAGHTLPMYLADRGRLRCVRDGAAALRFAVETRWGKCEAAMAAGEWEVRVDRQSRRPTAP
jgi:hypothetical protein